MKVPMKMVIIDKGPCSVAVAQDNILILVVGR